MDLTQREGQLLDWAITSCRTGEYPAGLSRDLKRSVRRAASSILIHGDGKVYVKRQKKLVEVVFLTEDKVRILNQYHSSNNTHWGWQKTWRAISRKFFWKRLSNDVKEWVAKCDVCRQRGNRQTSTDLGIPQQASDRSWEHVQGQTSQDAECCNLAYEEASGQQVAQVEEDDAAFMEDSEIAISVDRRVPTTLPMGSGFSLPSDNTRPSYIAAYNGPMGFGELAQATDGNSDIEACILDSSMAPPMGGKHLTGYSLRDHLITPQTESVQPMDSSSSAQVRHSPPALHLGSETYQPTRLHPGPQPTWPAVNMQPLNMTALYSSLLMEVSHSPCVHDRQYPAATPITPLEEQGRSYISEAVIRYVNTLSDSEGGSNLVHGRLAHPKNSTVSLPMAKVPKLHINDPGRTRNALVMQFPLFKLPPQCLTMEKYIQDNPLEGSYCVESLFQAVRFLEHLHRKIQSGCGAFSGLSSIQLCVLQESRDLVTFLIPELSKLAEAMKLKGLLPTEKAFTCGIGMVDDIKSLGDILKEFLSFLQERHIHVSRKLLQSLQSASELCCSAFTVVDETRLEQCLNGDDMAKIAQSLNVQKRLCTINVNHGMCRRSIVCYEGEDLYAVIDRAWMDGETAAAYSFDLFYDEGSELPVPKKYEAIFPVYNVYLVQQASPPAPPIIQEKLCSDDEELDAALAIEVPLNKDDRALLQKFMAETWTLQPHSLPAGFKPSDDMYALFQ